MLSLPLMPAFVLADRVCFADNPIVQTKYTADPAPLVYDDTVYLYTSHDEDDAEGFTMYNWLLYSSTDMANWTDHGIIAGVREPHKTFEWADGYNAWAPQVVNRNGRFYLYGPFPRGGHMVIGVAVADSPTGPFVDAIGAPLIDNPNSTYDIDPTVFVDDDGQAYLYWGHQPPLFYVTLNEDMISYSGDIVELPGPQTYEEGPWFYQRNGLYYLAFASTCCPEGIGYAMSDSPVGPWTYQGSLMDPNGASSGNHPGIIDYKGSSYLFGFNYEVLFARQTQKVERRSVCVERMSYDADGTIPTVDWWSTTGAPQIGTLNPFVQTEAETIAWAWDVRTETCSEGGMDVTGIENGDYIKVKGVDFGAGASSFEAGVASAGSGGAIEIRLDSQTGTLVGTCAVSGTGGAQTWLTESCPVSGASGVHDLYLVFAGGSGSLFNFNWWKFGGPGDPGTGGSGGAGGQGGAGATGGDATGGGGAGAVAGAVGQGGIANSGGLQAGGTSGAGGEVPSGGSPAAGGDSYTGGTTTVGPTGGSVSTGGAMIAAGGTVSPAGGSTIGGTGTAVGGQVGAGGSNAAGGAQSPGGFAGTGGASSSDVDAGPAGADASSDEGGCGCRVAGGRSSSGSLVAFGVLGWFALCSFRRRPKPLRQLILIRRSASKREVVCFRGLAEGRFGM
jgi:arabinoxylan arabinofuranohydrolase